MPCCVSCRDRHLKCDAIQPQCLVCVRTGRVCAYPAPKPRDIFRHAWRSSSHSIGEAGYKSQILAFSRDQIWVEIPSQLIFEDNTDEAKSPSDCHVSSDGPLTPSTSIDERTSHTSCSHTPSAKASGGDPMISDSSPSTVNFGHLENGLTPGSLRSISHPFDAASTLPNSITVSALLCGGRLLSDPTEGYLLRHFGRVVGPWLDLGDDERHFTLEVVRRAPTCPLLLNACLALSARQLARTKSFNSDIADDYRARCIEILIPLLSDPDVHADMDLMLASVVILRMEEQISCTKHADDYQHHLLGGSAFVNSRLDWHLAGGLTEAAFWAFVMQDIQFSLAWQTPLRLHFEPFQKELDQTWHLEPVRTAKSWVHRAIWLLAQTVQYCCSTDRPDDGKKAWEAIRTSLDDWERSRPVAFAPFYYRAAGDGDEDPLPTLWFSSSLHICALQHICMARVMLITCDPCRPRFGLRYGSYHREQQEQVIEYLKLLFGAAASTDDAAARHMIPIALVATYYWISGRTLQRRLLELVHMVGQDTGWEWTEIVDKLMSEWGWPDSEKSVEFVSSGS